MNPAELTTIVYLAHCIDGLTAAALALQYSLNRRLDYNFVAMQVGETPEEVMQMSGKRILFINVAPTLSEFHRLLSQHNEVNIRDRHSIALEELETVVDGISVIFDTSKSGATLALDIFGAPIEFHKLIYLVEDYELNTKKYGNTSQLIFFAMCNALEQTLISNDKISIVYRILNDYDGLLQTGSNIEAKNRAYVEECVDQGIISRLGPYTVFFTFTDSIRLCSEIGHRVLTDHKEVTFSMVISQSHDQFYTRIFSISLRSHSTFDVSNIAKMFGGGGNPQAASFRVKRLSKLFKALKTLT